MCTVGGARRWQRRDNTPRKSGISGTRGEGEYMTKTWRNVSTQQSHHDIGEHTTLGGDNAAFSESSKEQLEVGLLEQTLGRAFWVRRVGDDDIKAVLKVLQELEAISNVDLDLGVLEANGHSREIFLGETDDSLRINLATAHRKNMTAEQRTSSISQRVASSTDSCLMTSRKTPPSPPPMTRTFFGFGWEFMARWVIISWYANSSRSVH